jgi:hypothetical protein
MPKPPAPPDLKPPLRLREGHGRSQGPVRPAMLLRPGDALKGAHGAGRAQRGVRLSCPTLKKGGGPDSCENLSRLGYTRRKAISADWRTRAWRAGFLLSNCGTVIKRKRPDQQRGTIGPPPRLGRLGERQSQSSCGTVEKRRLKRLGSRRRAATPPSTPNPAGNHLIFR